jgi:hypothetical protein
MLVKSVSVAPQHNRASVCYLIKLYFNYMTCYTRLWVISGAMKSRFLLS